MQIRSYTGHQFLVVPFFYSSKSLRRAVWYNHLCRDRQQIWRFPNREAIQNLAHFHWRTSVTLTGNTCPCPAPWLSKMLPQPTLKSVQTGTSGPVKNNEFRSSQNSLSLSSDISSQSSLLLSLSKRMWYPVLRDSALRTRIGDFACNLVRIQGLERR